MVSAYTASGGLCCNQPYPINTAPAAETAGLKEAHIMNSYYWDATDIETGERVGGVCFAPSEEAAVEQLESYGLYCEIMVYECN